MPTVDYPLRNKAFILDFAKKIDIQTSWKNLTDTAMVELPRRIYIRDSNDNNIPLFAQSTTAIVPVNIGGFITLPNGPILMRGDKIMIYMGYYYPNPDSQGPAAEYIYDWGDGKAGTYPPVPRTEGEPLPPARYQGFISSIETNAPIVLHCEDSMFLAKKTAMPTKTYSAATGNGNLSNILNDIVLQINKTWGATLNSPITLEMGTATNPYDITFSNSFIVQKESAAQLLERLKKTERLYFYFRGNALRGGGIVYYPEDQSLIGNYGLEMNIVKDQLKYMRKDDIYLGAECYSVNVQSNGTNAKGGAKTKTKQLKTTVYLNPDGTIDTSSDTSGKADTTEFLTFYFQKGIKNQPITTIKQLQQLGAAQLQKYNYDGVRGGFTGFGNPFIQHGNVAALSSTLRQELNGNYLIKSVHTHFEASSNGGFKNDIELHFRIDNMAPGVLAGGL